MEPKEIKLNNSYVLNLLGKCHQILCVIRLHDGILNKVGFFRNQGIILMVNEELGVKIANLVIYQKSH